MISANGGLLFKVLFMLPETCVFSLTSQTAFPKEREVVCSGS